jgi:hypothetical protein
MAHAVIALAAAAGMVGALTVSAWTRGRHALRCLSVAIVCSGVIMLTGLHWAF